jgi:hypothetical protein
VLWQGKAFGNYCKYVRVCWNVCGQGGGCNSKKNRGRDIVGRSLIRPVYHRESITGDQTEFTDGEFDSIERDGQQPEREESAPSKMSTLETLETDLATTQKHNVARSH